MDNPITHTPGPWHAVGPGEFSPDWVIRDIVVGEETICSVYSDDADKDGRSLADAKLIAASPDLLEGLKFAIALFKAQGIDQFHRMFGENILLMNDAVRKATL